MCVCVEENNSSLRRPLGFFSLISTTVALFALEFRSISTKNVNKMLGGAGSQKKVWNQLAGSLAMMGRSGSKLYH